MSELRERLIFPGGSELWVNLRHIPRIGERVTIHANAVQCSHFHAVVPALFVVTEVEYEMDYGDLEAGDEGVAVYLEPVNL